MGCNTLGSYWMKDMEKWFGRWDATHLIHENITRFLCKWGLFATPMYHDIGEMWKLTLHTLYHTAPNYKTIFFAERENRTHRYMLEPILLSAIWTIAFMRLISHALRFETGRWAQVMRMVDYAHFSLNKSESRVSYFDSVPLTLIIFDPCFPHIFFQAQSLQEFLSQPQCALAIATFIGRDLLLTFTCFTWNVIFLLS